MPGDTAGDQVNVAQALLISNGQVPANPEDRPGPAGAVALAIGRLPYVRAEQVRAAERYLLSMMHAADADPLMRPALPDVTRGAESLFRLRARLAKPTDDTIDELRGIVINRRHEYPPQSRVTAMIALMAGGGVDDEALRTAANAATSDSDSVLVQLRRLAAVALAGAGAPVAPSERTELLTTLLADRAAIVRIEAVRAWARQEVRIHGCLRLYDALKDPSTPVVLAAVDAIPRVVQGRRERHGSADDRGADAAGALLASGVARARRAREDRPAARVHPAARQPHSAPDVAGPDVRGACGEPHR